jgi:tripartite-type tricarboxylate transporter receptor subunit TctC
MRHRVTGRAARNQTRMRSVARRSTALGYAAMFAVVAAPCITGAQDYPNRPIRMIAPFTAGSGMDAYARILAKKMSEMYQQQVVVDNRGGAGSVIGTEIVAKAAPNGYTILYTGSAHPINAAFRRALPYDSIKDFTPVSLFTEFPWYLVAHPSFPPQSVPELLALARSRPGQVNYASSAVGSGPHLAGEMFRTHAKVDIVHISYKGTAEATIAVLAGAVPLLFVGPTIMQTVKAGKLRVLGVTSDKRSSAWPDVPTIQEGGVPNYNFTQWHGVLVPRNTPKEVVARLQQAVVQAVQDPNIAKTLREDGAELRGNTPEQFRDFLLREVAKSQELARAMGGFKFD